MIYLSIDIETTGLDPDYCQVIEFGAVLDTGESLHKLARFHRYVYPGRIRGEPYALAMNHSILRTIADLQNHPEKQHLTLCRSEHLMRTFEEWLLPNLQHIGHRGPITVAGKNFGSFDLQFLKRLDGFGETVKYGHRFLDPCMLYFDPRTDTAPPSTETCYKRAGLPPTVAHTAIEDAMGVIYLLRNKGINVQEVSDLL